MEREGRGVDPLVIFQVGIFRKVSEFSAKSSSQSSFFSLLVRKILFLGILIGIFDFYTHSRYFVCADPDVADTLLCLLSLYFFSSAHFELRAPSRKNVVSERPWERLSDKDRANYM